MADHPEYLSLVNRLAALATDASSPDRVARILAILAILHRILDFATELLERASVKE